MASPEEHLVVDGRLTCPTPAQLAAYLDRRLARDERTLIEHHAAQCADCRDVLADAAQFLEHETDYTPAATRSAVAARRPLVAAGVGLAAVVVLGAGLAVWTSGSGDGGAPTQIAALVSASADEGQRLALGRLSGGFPYAPPPVVTRGMPGRGTSPEVRIAGAELEQQVRGDERPASRAAFGVARLVAGDLDGAVAALTDASRQRPGASAIANDLAVAHLARASRLDAAADWAAALAAAERALAADPAAMEPRFNRALALEGLDRTDEAIAAWERYREVEQDARWRREVDERLARLRAR